MGLIYGSIFELAKISSSEIGLLQTNSSTTNLNWLSILLNVIEIGGSLFLGPEIATGLALGNAFSQIDITYEETGNVDATSAGLNFAATVLPGALSGIKNLVTGAKLAENAAPLLKQLRSDTIKDIAGVVERYEKIASNLESKSNSLVGKFFETNTENRGNQFSKFFGNQVKLKQKLVEDITGLQNAKRLSPGQLDDLLKVGNLAGKGGSIQRSFRGLNVGRKVATGLGEAGVDTGADIESKIFSSITDETGLLSREIKALKNLIKDGEITNLKLYKSILEKAFKRTGNSLLEAAIAGTKSNKIIKLLSRTETNAMKLSRISSKSIGWATKVGGYLTSPSSLAADAISKTVAKITSKLEGVGEELIGKLSKWLKAGRKGMEAAEDEFVKTGGNLFKSKWIMGYKVLQEDDISSTILIQFKNSHPNVITKLSISKIKAFIEASSKGRWYINNIARSRGGRKLSELGIEGKLENVLGMLPIAKINEIVGFASFSKGFVQQIRANSGTLIWHTGNYIQGFKQGFIQGVISEGIKGAVSLGTTNQYAKQVLEGGFGAVSSGTSFGAAFSTSFAGAAQSMKDTMFEDTTKAGGVVKNVKVIQGTGNGFKSLV